MALPNRSAEVWTLRKLYVEQSDALHSPWMAPKVTSSISPARACIEATEAGE